MQQQNNNRVDSSKVGRRQQKLRRNKIFDDVFIVTLKEALKHRKIPVYSFLISCYNCTSKV